jgi:hypothetical protein
MDVYRAGAGQEIARYANHHCNWIVAYCVGRFAKCWRSVPLHGAGTKRMGS